MRLPTWPRPSTRAFIREARRTPGYSFFDWLHGYVYGRWPYLYIGIGTGEHPLARTAKPIIGWIDRLIRRQAKPVPSTPLSRAGFSGEVDNLSPNPSPRRRGEHVSPFPRREGDPGVRSELPFSKNLPLKGEVGGEVDFADTYHGKVVTLEAAKQLVRVQQDINLGDLEHIIPYALARAIVLQHPDHIAVLECPCRASRANPCTPLDVCLIVGEPFASFIVEHQRQRARWITPGEAVDILTAEHQRGHVHHAFFKDAMLGRFYAICNCCSCCCGAMQAQRNGVLMLAASGYVSRSNPELCIGCGTCADHCQFGAISMADGHSVVDEVACMGCGVCVDLCEQGGLSLFRDASKGTPLEINALMSAALGV